MEPAWHLVKTLREGNKMAVKPASSEHYAVLDGLRGFAALAVVVYHLGHWLNIPHLASNSHLAVEFFFCLSGYVLAKAYGGHRKQGLGMAGFIRVRLIRLMPLMVIGTVVSALYAGFRLDVTHELHLAPSLALAGLLGMLNLPYLGAPAPIGGPQVCPLNGPQYTLFLELFINFLWFPIRTRSPLGMAALIAAVCFGLVVIYGSGGDTAATFWHGFPRVGVSFFAGIALFELQRRYQIAQKIRPLFWPLFLVMIALFLAPHAFGKPVELAWIVLLSPLLVLTGLTVNVTGAMRRVCLEAGALSYPIYVLQYPIFCWINGIFQTVLHHRNPAIEAPLIFVSICALSAAATFWLDSPIRQALSGLRRRPSMPAGAQA
jgi:peptidoglycan/LPS O-acetylase OafA/YrhL